MQCYAREPCNHEHVSGDTEICNDHRFFSDDKFTSACETVEAILTFSKVHGVGWFRCLTETGHWT